MIVEVLNSLEGWCAVCGTWRRLRMYAKRATDGALADLVCDHVALRPVTGDYDTVGLLDG